MKLRSASLVSAGAFLFFFGFYLRSLSPAFHPDDSAETITAGATLSFQHPPGYPLHSLLGRLAVLAELGSPAFRVNLLSALLSAFGLLLFAWTLAHLEALLKGSAARIWPSLAGALILMPVKELWFQSSIAKGGLYTLNFALTQALVLALLRWRARLEYRWLALAFFVFGLGMANHWTSQVVLLPGLVLLGAEAWLKAGRPSLKAYWTAPAFAVPGFSLYLYLPIRAAQHPALPWGEPNSWAGFWWIFNRSQYAGVESGKNLESFRALISRVGENLGFEFSWLGLAALAFLWAWMFRKNWALALGLVAMPLSLAFAVCLKAKPPSDSVWIIDPYLVPLYSGLALGLASLALLDIRLRLLIPALAAWLFWSHKPLGFQRDNYLGWDYVNNLYLSCPRNALVFCEGDSNTAGPLYHRYVARKRPDLAPLAVVLSDYGWYRRELAHHNPGLKLPPNPLTPPGNISWMAEANLPRPAVVTNSFTKGWVDESKLAQRGLVGLMLKGPVQEADLVRNRIWEAYPLRGVFEPAHAMDPLTVRLVKDNYIETVARLAEAWLKLGNHQRSEGEYVRAGALKKGWAAPWVQAGNMAWFRKDVEAAGRHWERAMKEEPGSAEALSNYGLYCFEKKDYDQAMKLGHQALALRPGMPNALSLVERARGEINKRLGAVAGVEDATAVAARGDALAAQNKSAEALEAYNKAYRLGFRSANLHRNRAVLLARLNRMGEANKEIEAAVKADPSSAELWKFLGVFRHNAGDLKGAAAAFEKSLALKPGDAEVQSLLAQTKAKIPQ